MHFSVRCEVRREVWVQGIAGNARAANTDRTTQHLQRDVSVVQQDRPKLSAER